MHLVEYLSRQTNSKRRVFFQMHNQFIKNLLNLKDVIVDKVLQYENHCEVHISLPVSPHKCPNCGITTQKVHDYRKQSIKDIPLFNKPLKIIYNKRRYKCPKCNKNFYESVNFVGRYQRMTLRLIEAVVDKLRTNYSMSSIAKDYNISPCTVTRIFDCVSYNLKKLPEVLSIDEFKGTTEKGKYHCVLVDPVNSKVLDILDSRNLDYLINYFANFKDQHNVRYVVIDMWTPYKLAAQQMFPNAKIVIDRFHYIRNCLWAIDKVRKHTQRALPYAKAKFLKYSRRLLLTRPDRLNHEGKMKLANVLLTDERIRLAYILKEKFMDFVRSNNSLEADIKLSEWFELVKAYKINEFSYLAKTIKNWRKEILNSFDVPYTNGCVEGFNNKIKVIKRNAFGFRKFSRFRTRILHCCA